MVIPAGLIADFADFLQKVVPESERQLGSRAMPWPPVEGEHRPVT
ncbi:hypothetical protein [Mycobacterium sp. URHB0021]